MIIPTINKKHKVILLAALLFAAGSTVFMLAFRKTAKPPLSFNCFKTEQGWGYDVMANDSIIIHQPFIPGEPGGAGFGNEQQAVVAARIVIEKIKSGEVPSINHQQLQRSGVLRNQSKR